MQTSLVAPIVAILGLFLKEFFGITLGETELQIVTDGIIAISLALIGLYGVYKAYKEKKESK